MEIEVRCYYRNNYSGLEDSEVFNTIDEVKDYVWSKLQDGSYIIIDNCVRLSPDDCDFEYDYEGCLDYIDDKLNEYESMCMENHKRYSKRRMVRESLADYEDEKQALANYLGVDVSEIEKSDSIFVGWKAPTFEYGSDIYCVADSIDTRSDIYDYAKRKIADDWDSYGFDMFGGDNEPIQYICLYILGDDFFIDLLDGVHYDDDDYESDYLYAWEEFRDSYGLDEEVVTSAVDTDALAEYLIDNYGIANYVDINGEENYEGEYFIYQIY